MTGGHDNDGRGAGRQRGGAQISPDTQARSEEIQRQLKFTASEQKHFELVCEVKPDWNNAEVVDFLRKCSFNSTIINTGLMNAFEDLRPSEDQSASQWNVKSKKVRRKKDVAIPQVTNDATKPKSHTPGNFRRERNFTSAPQNRLPRHAAAKDEGSRPNAANASQSNWGLSSSGGWGEPQPTVASSEPSNASSGFGETATTASEGNAAGGWGSAATASSELKAASSGWGTSPSEPKASAGRETAASEPKVSAGWGTPATSASEPNASSGWGAPAASASEPKAAAGWGTVPTPAAQNESSSGWESAPAPPSESSKGWGDDSKSSKTALSGTEGASEAAASANQNILSSNSSALKPTTTWAGMMKRHLDKKAPAVETVPVAKVHQAVASVAEVEQSVPVAEITGTWSTAEPACSANPEPDAEVETPVPQVHSSLATSTDDNSTPEQAVASTAQDTEKPEPSVQDIFLFSDPVILPEYVAQQASSFDSTTIQFGSFSLESSEGDIQGLPSSHLESVKSTKESQDPLSNHANNQQLLQHHHGISSEDSSAAAPQVRQQYPSDNAIPHPQQFGLYPSYNVHSYMGYEQDSSGGPTYYDPYVQHPQRPSRPRQPAYNNVRGSKPRRGDRGSSGTRNVHSHDEFVQNSSEFSEPPSQPQAPFAQGGSASEKESQSKQPSMSDSNRNNSSRNNKQRHHQGQQVDRSRGGYHGHPSYSSGPIPVGYAQPYAYPPYMPQYYGQSQQGYGPPGFRPHYPQYQQSSQVGYQGGYQGSVPRPAFVGQPDYVENANVHQSGSFLQSPNILQGEQASASGKSEPDHDGAVPVNTPQVYQYDQSSWQQMQDLQHRQLLQQQQFQGNGATGGRDNPEGSVGHNSFDRRPDSSPVQQSSYGYAGQQGQMYSPSQNFQGFTNHHSGYGEATNRGYPHWTNHQ